MQLKQGIAFGVWDLFHIGHLRCLKRCMEDCDYLIVGVQRDNIIEREKGHKPIFNELERMEIVGSLYMVSGEVFLYEDQDYFKAYQQYQADVLFVGEDQNNGRFTDLIRKVQESGGEVVRIPRYPGISTTEIKRKVKELC